MTIEIVLEIVESDISHGLSCRLQPALHQFGMRIGDVLIELAMEQEDRSLELVRLPRRRPGDDMRTLSDEILVLNEPGILAVLFDQ